MQDFIRQRGRRKSRLLRKLFYCAAPMGGQESERASESGGSNGGERVQNLKAFPLQQPTAPMVEGAKPASQPPSFSVRLSLLPSFPFKLLQWGERARQRRRRRASSLARSIALGAKGGEEGTSLKFISQPPPLMLAPPLELARRCRRPPLQIRQTKRKPVSVGSPSLSLSPFLSTVLPKRDEADSLTAPPQRGGGGSNFWM